MNRESGLANTAIKDLLRGQTILFNKGKQNAKQLTI